MGSAISRCWRYNNVEERHDPYPHNNSQCYNKEKNKEAIYVLSTKMEICTQCFGNMVCLFAQGETSKAFQEEI